VRSSKNLSLGLHEWVVSFDVASMYPHIIREWNLSPEMIAQERVEGYTVDDPAEAVRTRPN
jgi:DNA polymerase elongation subunit (family B)